jgi:hypothetical protein
MSDVAPGVAIPEGTPRPADRPPLPKSPRNKKALIFWSGLAALIVSGYSITAFGGWEPGAPKRDEIPGSVRASPGGYRSYQYWHSGYHGGK